VTFSFVLTLRPIRGEGRTHTRYHVRSVREDTEGLKTALGHIRYGSSRAIVSALALVADVRKSWRHF
jgi:hypothetical protein